MTPYREQPRHVELHEGYLPNPSPAIPPRKQVAVCECGLPVIKFDGYNVAMCGNGHEYTKQHGEWKVRQ